MKPLRVRLKYPKLPPASWWVVFFLVYLSTFFLSGTRAPSVFPEIGPVDVSWQMVLEYAARFKFQFGRDIVFTFGPLGFLFTEVSQGYLVGLRVAFALFWTGLVAWSAAEITFRLAGLARWLFLVWFLVFSSSGGQLERGAFFVMLFGCSVLAGDVRDRRISAALFVIVFAVLALVKFTFFMAAAASVAVCALLHACRKDFVTSLLLPGMFGAAIVGLWLLVGQQLAGLLPWLKGSIEIAGGYTEAMSLPAGPWTLAAGIGTWIVLLAALLRRLRLNWPSMGSAGYLLLLLMYAFLSWKQGFVRADIEHVFHFIYFLPFVFGLLLANPFDRALQSGVGRADCVLFVLAVVFCLCATVAQSGPFREKLYSWPQRMQRNASLLANIATGAAERCYVALQPGFHPPSEWDMPNSRKLIGNASIDVISYQQSAALVNGFNYRPRPVIQGYFAYTPYLQNLNLSFFKGVQRPEYLLFRMETIDNRFATLDDATILPYILYNYMPIAGEGQFLIMKRNAEVASDTQLRMISEKKISFGEKLSLEGINKNLIVMKVNVKPSILGVIVKLLYHAQPIEIGFSYDGFFIKKRFVPSMAKQGFILNTYVSSNKDIVDIYKNEGNIIKNITFIRPAGAFSHYLDSVEIELYELTQ